MITKKHTALIALAVCALALAAVGSVKNPVSRPFKTSGNVTATIHLNDGTGEWEEWGEATEAGRYSNRGWTTDYGASWSGVATTADGDQAFWVMPGASWEVQWTGGTGRFTGLTGGFNVVASPWVITYPDPTTMVMKNTYVGEGTFTY